MANSAMSKMFVGICEFIAAGQSLIRFNHSSAHQCPPWFCHGCYPPDWKNLPSSAVGCWWLVGQATLIYCTVDIDSWLKVDHSHQRWWLMNVDGWWSTRRDSKAHRCEALVTGTHHSRWGKGAAVLATDASCFLTDLCPKENGEHDPKRICFSEHGW